MNAYPRGADVVKIEIDGVFVYVDNVDQALDLIARYSRRGQSLPALSDALGAVKVVEEAKDSEETDKEAVPDKPRLDHRRDRYVPTQVKIPSATKKEALLKLYQGLEMSTHKNALRLLASKDGAPVHVGEVRKALGVPENYKISGFSAAMTRRAPAYGLHPDDIMIVEYLGAVSGKRIYTYRLAPEMLEMMREQGLTNPSPAFAISPNGDVNEKTG